MYGHFEARCNSQTSSNTKASSKYVARLTCIINFHIVFLGVLHFFFFFNITSHFSFLTESNTRFPLLEVFFLLCALFASDFNTTHITGKLAL